MTLSPAFLDELRARTPLTSLIERKVKLVKAGSEKKGCCPFHGEKTPSFYVNDSKGFYHCFGCAAHGDAIRWMTDHEQMPFMDAVKELAAAAGMEMPDRDPRHAERDRDRDVAFEVMARAAAWFAQQLWSTNPAAQRAQAYGRERGILKRGPQFNIGYAPASGLREHLKDVGDPMLEKLGLIRTRDERVSDFFRNRIMFPIRDQRGRTIGFGGRVLGDQQPKYLNSPDTPVFDKGRTLYNIDRAGPAARAAGRLLVVEGYMDVIGLSAAAGVDETVAPNGTALTEEQIARLWRLHERPILCFDGDMAGRAAAARAASRALPMLEPGKSLAFVTPPDGQDPDDVARQGGREAIDAMLATAAPLADVLWRHEHAAAPVDTPEAVAGLKMRLREHVRSIRNADVREAYGQDMARRFRDAFEPAAERGNDGPRRAPLNRASSTERQPFSRRQKPQTAASKTIARAGMAQNVERAVLAGLMRHPDVVRAEMEAVALARFSHEAAVALRDVIVDAAVAGEALIVPPALEQAAAYARTGPLRFSFTTDGADVEVAKRDLVDSLYQLRR